MDNSAYAQALSQYQNNAQGLGISLAPFFGQQAPQEASVAPQQGANLSPQEQQILAAIMQAQGQGQSGPPMPTDPTQQLGIGQPMQAPSIPDMPYTAPGQTNVIANRPIYPGLTGGVDYKQYQLS